MTAEDQGPMRAELDQAVARVREALAVPYSVSKDLPFIEHPDVQEFVARAKGWYE